MVKSVRGVTSNYFAVQMNGGMPGEIKGVSGLGMENDVIENKFGASLITRKTIGQRSKFSDATFKIGMSSSREMLEWVRAAWRGQYKHMDMEVISMNFSMQALATMSMYGCLLTSCTVPGVDAKTANKTMDLTATVAMEQMIYNKAGGEVVKGDFNNAPMLKDMVTDKFQFSGPIDGSQLVSTGDIKFTIELAEHSMGGLGYNLKVPKAVKFDDLELTFNNADNSMSDWQELSRTFLMQGNSSNSNEFTIGITYQNPMGDDMFLLELYNCGIKKFTLPDFQADSGDVSTFKVGLYIESGDLKFLG